jgi:hypothetical protein
MVHEGMSEGKGGEGFNVTRASRRIDLLALPKRDRKG